MPASKYGVPTVARSELEKFSVAMVEEVEVAVVEFVRVVTNVVVV